MLTWCVLFEDSADFDDIDVEDDPPNSNPGSPHKRPRKELYMSADLVGLPDKHLQAAYAMMPRANITQDSVGYHLAEVSHQDAYHIFIWTVCTFQFWYQFLENAEIRRTLVITIKRQTLCPSDKTPYKESDDNVKIIFGVLFVAKTSDTNMKTIEIKQHIQNNKAEFKTVVRKQRKSLQDLATQIASLSLCSGRSNSLYFYTGKILIHLNASASN